MYWSYCMWLPGAAKAGEATASPVMEMTRAAVLAMVDRIIGGAFSDVLSQSERAARPDVALFSQKCPKI